MEIAQNEFNIGVSKGLVQLQNLLARILKLFQDNLVRAFNAGPGWRFRLGVDNLHTDVI